jgi:hypothetical protein
VSWACATFSKAAFGNRTNRVRIAGQLIDAASGTHLWADRFEDALEDVFELQVQVTASVVGAIGPRLQQAEIERGRRKPTESLHAYEGSSIPVPRRWRRSRFSAGILIAR